MAVPRFRPETLIEARKKADLTQADLAKRAERIWGPSRGEPPEDSATEVARRVRVMQDRISAWERGVDAPTAPYIPMVARALKINPLDLFDVDPAAPPFTALRLVRGWTLTALAQETGINYSSLHRWSRGVAPMPNEAAAKLAKALHVTRAELVASIDRER
ncbi:helix-turn-helix domain-containing protein [Jatrophihabitans cynanchi]|uniref:Helix-turn-helix domain-containing protein n=1 Tax=Jatrophihabitans cynanchi TaxID=2944128 RepID=A0ABY7K1D8_9ACTN|nr:helix-turn-helix transcriptional regulator [Jatrophihabitans sp. SB3-54]WAX58489.1 helix-turn-helix domain-containing protein [Jatrophihabitans sp. SB3-54]